MRRNAPDIPNRARKTSKASKGKSSGTAKTWLRRLLLLALMAGALAGAGIYLPRLFANLSAMAGSIFSVPSQDKQDSQDKPSSDTPKPRKPSAQNDESAATPSAPTAAPKVIVDPLTLLTASPQDSAGDTWERNLFKPLERAFQLPPKSVRRNTKTPSADIRFPKGLPLHEYAYAVETACARNGITVAEANEVRLSGGRGSQARYLLRRDGQTLQLTLRLGDQARPGSARLALVILGLDSISLSDAALLRDTPIPINLAFDPHNGNPALQALKTSGGEITLLAEVPMEPTTYPYVNPGKHALYIHFDEKAVHGVLEKAFAEMTQARGMVTRLGDRAIENRLLLRRVYSYLTPRHLPLLDVTGSPRSLAQEVAAEQGGMALRAEALRDTSVYDMELAKKVAKAVKSGESVFAMRYSKVAFTHLLALIDERMPDFIEQGLAFVPLTHLRQMPAPAQESDSSATVN